MSENKQKLPEETIKSLIELGEVLRGVCERLLAEGKVRVVDGKIEFLDTTTDS
jgi:hypothetical protein